MRKRKSIANWLFFFVGILLLLACVLAALPLVVGRGLLSPVWDVRASLLLDEIRQWLPTEEQLRFVAWLVGIAASAIGAVLTLLASWHFAEMNLPRRLEDLAKAMVRVARAQQPPYLALARAGLGRVLPDIETNRFVLVRRWLSGWSERTQARVLAASHNKLAQETRSLTDALRAAQQQQITAHLIRGYQYAEAREDQLAFEEFEAATRVRVDDIVSRDIAAGWARRMKNEDRENRLLTEMEEAATGLGQNVDHARALRRKAELLANHQDDRDRPPALRHLRNARNLLRSRLTDEDARVELGRVLTLFCELRCDADTPWHLNGHVAGAQTHMRGVRMHAREEEPDGEEYGQDRADAVAARVAAIIAGTSP
jgi:hypothetical protein